MSLSNDPPRIPAASFAAIPEGNEGVREDVPLPDAPEPEGDPLFEVIIPSALHGVTTPAYHFKMWGDGRTAGFDKLPAGWGKRMVVINRTPTLVREMLLPFVELVDGGLMMADLLAGEAKVVSNEEFQRSQGIESDAAKSD